ncbi:MAG TPA: SOS response-associated peptidase, partial [Actinobacteria bacterium]|nr:SOS response-associated peptidase [Actinomycetota bacterium]
MAAGIAGLIGGNVPRLNPYGRRRRRAPYHDPMCGRIVQAREVEIYADYFHVDRIATDPLPPRWNVAPGTDVYSVAEHDDNRLLGTFRWGFIPSWAKDPKIGYRTINARLETLDTKPMFRSAFRRRRCLVPADGFYEWERRPDGKLPHFVHASTDDPLPLAGLWSSWTNPETGARLHSCTIVTGPPNRLVGRLHDRMPVIVPEELWDRWLDPDYDDTDTLKRLLSRPYPDDALAEHPVSTLV